MAIRFVVAALAVLAEGCGVPGPPVPPTPKIPQPPSNLVAEQRGERVLLRWTLPRLHTNGTRLEGVPTIEIHRAFFDEAEKADRQFSQRARPVYVLPPQVVDSFQHGEIAVFPDVLGHRELGEQAGRTAVYAVKAVNKKGQDAGFSNRAEVRVFPVPTPVEDLAAEVSERAIRLRWSPPTETTSGTPIEAVAGHQIYRSPTGEEGSFALVGTTATATYEDFNVTLGETYFYRVGTLAQFGADTVESALSARVEVFAPDRYPPAPPAGLIAVGGPGEVNLTWDASVSRDTAGYFLYRSTRPDALLARLNPDPITLLSYADTEVEAGVTYYYAVTAVDNNGNESARSDQTTATPFAPE